MEVDQEKSIWIQTVGKFIPLQHFLYMKENDRKISEWYNEEKTGDGLGLVVSNIL